jgi:hypothetical protein
VPGVLPMLTVYERPLDYPTEYVVRLWYVQPDGSLVAAPELFARGPTLDSVRAQIPPDMACIPRLPGDEAQIVEVWL